MGCTTAGVQDYLDLAKLGHSPYYLAAEGNMKLVALR